jgi:hypothetical protein
VQVGSAADEGTVYARDAARSMVFTVETAFADELKKNAIDFRRKDVFDFRSFNANRVELVRDGKMIAFERTKGTEKDATEKWQLTAPEQRDVDQGKLDTLLLRLSSLRATDFRDSGAPPGSKPVLEVLVKYDGGKREDRGTLTRSGADAYGVRPDEPGAARFEASALDDTIKSLDEVLAPAAPPTPTKD